MYIDMTEKELAYKFNKMTNDEIVEWLMEEGLSLKLEIFEIEEGVYRRKFGMDMAEWDGRKWEAFNPTIVGTQIKWTTFPIENPHWWVKVLDEAFRPVLNGMEILINSDGKIIDCDR